MLNVNYESRPAGSIAHRDSKSYFTIHQNNLRKWFARLGLEQKPGWIALRDDYEAARVATSDDKSEGDGAS